MTSSYEKVKNFLLDTGYLITVENEADGVLVIENESVGIKNFVLGCADPLLILEQHILDLKDADADVYKQLLQKNRDIIHGAFVLDESGEKLIFRDTLQILNLDKNELEESINSLGLLLSEYSEQLITFSKR